MRFTYDPRYNIAYIRLQEKQAEVETIQVSDELVVDMAPDGTIYGIELLNAKEQLGRENGGRLLVVNEATGEHVELPLWEALAEQIIQAEEEMEEQAPTIQAKIREARAAYQAGEYVTIDEEQYIIDTKGKKTAVILPIRRYERLMEDLHDLAIIAERREEEPTSLEELKRRLKEGGLL